MEFQNILIAFGLTLFADLSTGIGSSLAFFGGIAFIGIIDKLVPSFENPHEVHKIEEMDEPERAANFRKLYRMGLFTAFAIAIHNFPEAYGTIKGMSTPSYGTSTLWSGPCPNSKPRY